MIFFQINSFEFLAAGSHEAKTACRGGKTYQSSK